MRSHMPPRPGLSELWHVFLSSLRLQARCPWFQLPQPTIPATAHSSPELPPSGAAFRGEQGGAGRLGWLTKAGQGVVGHVEILICLPKPLPKLQPLPLSALIIDRNRVLLPAG